MSATQEIVYPVSDGKRITNNGVHFEFLLLLYPCLQRLYIGRDDVFLGSNQFWYPVRGRPDVVETPTCYLAFGRPRGFRESWRQWEEDGVPMTVVFLLVSKLDAPERTEEKVRFFGRHGTEECYVYDPEKNDLQIHVRLRGAFTEVFCSRSFVSPRMGIRFDVSGPSLRLFYPDGRPFLTIQQDESLRRKRPRQAELTRKSWRGQASAEELAELGRLEDEQLAS